MTSMPAEHFGLATAGALRPGMAADLVCARPRSPGRRARRFEHPLAYVQGVDEVLVNGVPVVEAGEHTARARAAISRRRLGGAR